MKRALQRPDDDDDDYYGGAANYGNGNRGVDHFGRKTMNFVRSEAAPAKPVDCSAEEEPSGPRPLTADERNALAAKILKAELSGKMDRAASLRRKLEAGVADDNAEKKAEPSADKNVVLLKMDQKNGLVMPASSSKKDKADSARNPKASKSTVMNAFEAETSLEDLVAAEKKTTAEDQLNLFSQAMKMAAGKKTDDDWNLDDNIADHRKRARHADEHARSTRSKNIAEHKTLERTLNSCSLCLESPRFDKAAVVSVAQKTYLAVVPWKGLDEFHCRITTSEHYASTVTLDEDVYEELKSWKKALVAFFLDREEDCAFIETAKMSKMGRHMSIECIPMPKETGDLLPIYFKQALETAGAQWATHKKIYELKAAKDGSVRTTLPKGFSYFAVDFGLEPGFAHVIEDEERFSDHFGQEIVAGMIDAHHKQWRNVDQEKLDELRDKRDRFKEQFKPFDWTKEAAKNEEQ